MQAVCQRNRLKKAIHEVIVLQYFFGTSFTWVTISTNPGAVLRHVSNVLPNAKPSQPEPLARLVLEPVQASIWLFRGLLLSVASSHLVSQPADPTHRPQYCPSCVRLPVADDVALKGEFWGGEDFQPKLGCVRAASCTVNGTARFRGADLANRRKILRCWFSSPPVFLLGFAETWVRTRVCNFPRNFWIGKLPGK